MKGEAKNDSFIATQIPPYGKMFKKCERIIALNTLYKEMKITKNDPLSNSSARRHFG